MIDAKTCINDAQEKMDMAVMYLEEALAHIRAGKASTRDVYKRQASGTFRQEMGYTPIQ